jgi:hypothetical protein
VKGARNRPCYAKRKNNFFISYRKFTKQKLAIKHHCPRCSGMRATYHAEKIFEGKKLNLFFFCERALAVLLGDFLPQKNFVIRKLGNKFSIAQ